MIHDVIYSLLVLIEKLAFFNEQSVVRIYYILTVDLSIQNFEENSLKK